MTLELDVRRSSVPLESPFSIARGTQEQAQLLHVAVRAGDHVGWGEGCPSPAVTGETLDAAAAHLSSLDPAELDPDDPSTAHEALEQAGPAARAALDLALHDLAGKRANEPAHKLLGLPDDVAPSAATVPFTNPAQASEDSQAWIQRAYLLLKVKINGASDALEIVRAVEQHLPEELPDRFPEPEIWVDANESLELQEAIDLAPAFAEHRVTVLEQPLPRGDQDDVVELASVTELEIILDEDVKDVADVRVLDDHPRNVGINVKVQKVGGLQPATACVSHAKDQGRPVLVGCNIESGLGIAAGALFAGQADRLDLDGNLFLAYDPFPLPRPMPGHVGTPEGPGLGVHPDPRYVEPVTKTQR